MKRFFIVFLVLLAVLAPGFSQEDDFDFEKPIYTKGDHIISFSAGLIVPLFTQDRYANMESFGSQLSLGGVGNLEWNGYIRPNMKIGAQLSGMFAITPNKRTLTMVPITAKFTYVFDLYPWSVPVFLGAGVSFNKLGSLFEFTPILKPGAGLMWHMKNNWELGGQVVYWWVPEFHIKDLAHQTRFGNFLEISFCAIYHF